MAEATERNARKVRQGIVSSIMGNKSIVVTLSLIHIWRRA